VDSSERRDPGEARVNLTPKHISSRCVSAIAVVFAFLAAGPALFAQTTPIADRLSPNTVIAVEWHGTASLAGADKKNHVLQLLEDPALAPLWAAVTSRLQQSAKKSPNTNSAVALSDLVSLLENPAVFGVSVDPDAAKSSSPEDAGKQFAFFGVYDGTGKTGLIQKLKSSSAAAGGQSAAVTNYDFGGTQVEVRTSGKDTSYDAQVSSYFLFANRKQIMEDLISRFRASARPAASLSQLPAYQEMRKYLGAGDALEFFARIPDVSQWNIPALPNQAGEQLANNLHLEKIHALGFGVSFAGEATRLRGAALGDTSPPGVFDLAGSSKSVFQTQNVVNGSSTFSMTRFDLAVTYKWIRGVAVASAPPEQAAAIPALEAMGQNFLGMPIPDALALLTGEFASVSAYSDDGTATQLFAVTIQKPEAILRILRAVLADKIAAEDSSGSTTYLDISFPYTDPQTKAQRTTFYYAAVTPDLILVASKKPLLRQAVERLAGQTSASPAAGIFANPEYAAMRSRLPARLSSLSGVDLTQIPWAAILANFGDQSAQAGKKTNGAQPPDMSSLKLLKPEVIPQHLHMALGGSWKDSSGVYFDTYIQ
jgi:hypothetical protein